MRDKKVTYMLQAAMIAAIYVVLVWIFQSTSFGFIQFRLAEVMTILPYFTSAAVPGLTIGCLLANILGGAIVPDVVFGSAATLIGAVGTYYAGRQRLKQLTPVPPIVANTLIVPFVLKYGYGLPETVPYMMFTVGVSEIVVCGVLGMMLFAIVDKLKNVIFDSVSI